MTNNIIKTGIILMAMFISGAMGAQTHLREGAKTSDILIAYFSYSGNTRRLAEQIRLFTGGDLFEIQTVKAYPKEYEPCTEVAKKEKEENARPLLKTKVDNMDRYKVVFVGCPSWWHTAPMAVLSFLESYDFSGKTIIPFLTHESREDGAFAAIEKWTPKSKRLKGFEVYGSRVDQAAPDVRKWLKEIGFDRNIED